MTLPGVSGGAVDPGSMSCICSHLRARKPADGLFVFCKAHRLRQEIGVRNNNIIRTVDAGPLAARRS